MNIVCCYQINKMRARQGLTRNLPRMRPFNYFQLRPVSLLEILLWAAFIQLFIMLQWNCMPLSLASPLKNIHVRMGNTFGPTERRHNLTFVKEMPPPVREARRAESPTSLISWQTTLRSDSKEALHSLSTWARLYWARHTPPTSCHTLH